MIVLRPARLPHVSIALGEIIDDLTFANALIPAALHL
jgi:hypothetical protein